jgi:hypothetical protein
MKYSTRSLARYACSFQLVKAKTNCDLNSLDLSLGFKGEPLVVLTNSGLLNQALVIFQLVEFLFLQSEY